MIVPTKDECVVDEPKVQCIVRDLTNADAQMTFNLNLPVSYTGKQLVEEVGSRLGYQPDSFSLTYEKPVDDALVEIEMSAFLETKLGDCLVNVGNQKRNIFNVMDKDGIAPVKVESKDSGDDAVNLGATASASTENRDIYANSSNTWSSGSSYNYSYSLNVSKSETGFVGLVNQAMTCYLNSLLQTLYMTPEFRNAVYRWAFDGGNEEMVKKSIPYQLQRLFLLLQTSTKRAIETTDITKSFGWDSGEAWQQHDVQELMRVMFDALEKKWKNTAQSDLINKLYQGRMKDYVKCLEKMPCILKALKNAKYNRMCVYLPQCGSESARTDCYLDIPLTIRPFGSENSYSSVDESLQAFVQHELLEGGNQYFCEKCNQKCNAHKGLKFQSFPYLLTLQLKRFDFDYTTMHRIKLNDKMSFPQILNLNHLIEEQNPEGTDGTEAETRGEEGGGGERMDSSPSAASSPPPPEPPNPGDKEQGPDEGIEIGYSASGGTRLSNSEAAANDRNTQDMGKEGPYVYELYSIMIHSGSAAGGHYYAYIKSFKDGQWYSFNDQHVSTITFDDIKKTYGGSGTRGYYSATYSSSTNGYMLVYRQIDKQRNEECMAPEEFPEHLQRELYKLQNREEEEKKQKELDRSTCKIKLFCFHPGLVKQLESKLEVHKDTSLQEATEIAWKQFNLDKVVSLEDVRLVKYDEYHDYIECSFEGDVGQTMEEVLDGVKATYVFDLLLEIRKPGSAFQEYKPGGITVKVLVCDLREENIKPLHTIRAYNTQTVGELKTQVSEELGLPLDTMRCVLEKYSSDLRLLTVPTKTLKAESFFKSNKVFVECSGLENDDEILFPDTKFAKLLDRYEHTIRVIVVLPPYPTKGQVSDSYLLTYNMQGKATHMVDCLCGPIGHFIKFKFGTGKVLAQHSRSNDPNADIKRDFESNNDSDEGIGDESVPPAFTNGNTCDGPTTTNNDVIVENSNAQAGASVTGPLRSSSTLTSAEQQSQMHSFISDTIHKLSNSNGSESSLPHHQSVQSLQSEDSESTVTSSLDSNSTVTSCSTVTPSEPNTYMDEDEHALNSDLLSSKVSSVATSQSASAAADAAAASGASCAGEAELDMTSKPKTRMNTEGWDDMSDATKEEESEDEYSKYCTARLNIDAETKERGLKVYVDKRITLKSLKKILEQYVGTTSDHFKIYKVYSNNQEIECTRGSETLLGYTDDTKLIVKLGRALKVGEFRVKIFQLQVNDPEPSKFLTELIIGRGMTVATVRRMVVEELKEQCDVVIPLERCRVRKKTWKTPSTIYLDEQVFDHDIPMVTSLELFVEELVDGPERMHTQIQMSVYVRRWSPSKYEVGPFEEIIIRDSQVSCLKEEISKLSGIPVEQVEFARAKGTFPCEVSVLDAQTELEWNPNATVVNAWPLSISDDGCIVYYRDSEETLLELNDEKKRELQQKENIRLSRYSTYGSRYNMYSRKEKALKIYTDDTPTKETPPLPPPYSPIGRAYGPVNNTFFNTNVDSATSATGDLGDTELD